MAIKLGINGFGRIGSIALRIALHQPVVFDVVAIAKREADIDYMLYMIKYDTVYLEGTRCRIHHRCDRRLRKVRGCEGTLCRRREESHHVRSG